MVLCRPLTYRVGLLSMSLNHQQATIQRTNHAQHEQIRICCTKLRQRRAIKISVRRRLWRHRYVQRVAGRRRSLCPESSLYVLENAGQLRIYLGIRLRRSSGLALI